MLVELVETLVFVLSQEPQLKSIKEEGKDVKQDDETVLLSDAYGALPSDHLLRLFQPSVLSSRSSRISLMCGNVFLSFFSGA